MCYEKLKVNFKFFIFIKTLKIPTEWTEEVELNNLLIRSKPFSDKEAL